MTSTSTSPGRVGTVLAHFHVDVPGIRSQPRVWCFVAATIVAVVGSVAACALLAQLGMLVFPATRGYEHFRVADYTKLTVVGVIIASFGWPLTAALSSRARRLYLWAAIVVTVVSFAPDAWILMHGQSPAGVFVLAIMHVAVAYVTYWAMVLIAPQRERPASPAH